MIALLTNIMSPCRTLWQNSGNQVLLYYIGYIILKINQKLIYVENVPHLKLNICPYLNPLPFLWHGLKWYICLEWKRDQKWCIVQITNMIKRSIYWQPHCFQLADQFKFRLLPPTSVKRSRSTAKREGRSRNTCNVNFPPWKPQVPATWLFCKETASA